MGRLVRDDRKATVTHITTRYNQGMQNTISELGVDRLSAWPIIGADIKHFTDYRYRPF